MRALAVLAALLMNTSWVVAAPDGGTSIRARASGTYTPAGSVRAKTLYSNGVSAVVTAVSALTLSSAQARRAVAGSTVVFSHVLTNSGNVRSDYHVTLDHGDCGSQLPMAPRTRLALDTNANGQLDAGDVGLDADRVSPVRLLPGQSASLLLEVVVPTDAVHGYCVRVGARTHDGGMQAFAHDRVVLAEDGAVLEFQQVVQPAIAQQSEASALHFFLSVTNTGRQDAGVAAQTPDGVSLLVDGGARALVLLSVPIPLKMQLQTSSVRVLGSSGLVLYRYRGDLPYSFRSSVVEGAELLEIAVGLPERLPVGAQLGLEFCGEWTDVAGAPAVIQAQALFYEGTRSVMVKSNAVALNLRLNAGLALSLAAAATYANVDRQSNLDGSATTRFQLTLRNGWHAPVYDVGMRNVLEDAVQGLGRYTPTAVPTAGHYTVVANSLRVVDAQGTGAVVIVNRDFTGQPGAAQVLTPGTMLQPGGHITAQFDVRFHLGGVPPTLVHQAQAHAAIVPGGTIALRTLSRNGHGLSPSAQQAVVTHQQATPFSGRPPTVVLQHEVDTVPVAGQFGSYDLNYALTVTNSGPVAVGYLRLLDNLQCAFAPAPGGDADRWPVAGWQLLSAPKSDAGLLVPAPGFTGVGDCDATATAHHEPMTGLPFEPTLALVDGPVNLPVGSVDTVRFTVRVTLKPDYLGAVNLFSNRAWVAIMQPLSTLPSAQLPLRQDGTHALLWANSALVGHTLSEPSGVVYHALTRQPVAGAQVTMSRESCAGAATTPIVASEISGDASGYVFNADGSVSTLTDANGRYYFVVNTPVSAGLCTYAMQVVPPAGSGLQYPSRLITPSPQVLSSCGPVVDSATAPQLDQDTTYYNRVLQGVDAQSNATCSVFHNNIPLDAALGQGSGLMLQKQAQADAVEWGDTVGYSLTMANFSSTALSDVVIFDHLPEGFRFEPGSAQLAGQALPDPVGGGAEPLQFMVPGSLQNGGTSLQLTYRVRVGVGARRDALAVNRAWAVAAQPAVLRSNEAAARVRVVGGVFSDDAYAFGKVFMDCNGDGVQGVSMEHERGLAGVRLFLEDGTSVLTDSEGKWSLYGLRPLTHVLRLDTSTLPAGRWPIVTDQRQAGQADSQFLDLRNGAWRKANFAIGPCGVPTDGTPVSSLPVHVSEPESDPKPDPASGMHVDPVTLEDQIRDQDNAPAFLNLYDQQVLSNTVYNVRVKGPADSGMALLVNGILVEDRRVGTLVRVDGLQLEAREYVGVALQPGANALQLQVSDAFGNVRSLQDVRVVVPGDVARIALDLPATAGADPKRLVPVVVQLLDAQGVGVSARTLVTLESQGVRWNAIDINPLEPGVQIVVEGGLARLALVPPSASGDAVLRVSAGSVAVDADMVFLPDLRPLTGVGLLEGVLRFDGASGIPWAHGGATDAFESELRAWSADNGHALHAGARSAFYFKGAVQGSYLLTLAFDSEKSGDTPMFRDIQPDRFYPVYGDSAEKGFDAQSSQRLYLRIDHNRSYLLLGDYNAASSSEVRQLSQVARKLTGVRHVYQGDRTRIHSHISQDALKQVVREFPANGTSGPFYLDAAADLFSNSETVSVIVRDRNQPNRVVRSTLLTRHVNYSVDSLGKSILLSAPLASFNAGMNPQSIRIAYAVSHGGAASWVGGVDVQHKWSDRVQIGGVVEVDDAPGESWQLAAATWLHTLDAETVWSGEWVASYSELQGDGQAVGMRLTHAGEALGYHVQWNSSDASFVNPSAAIVPGQDNLYARMNYALRPDVDLKADLRSTWSEPLAANVTQSGVQMQSASLGLLQRFGPNVSAELGLHHGLSNPGMASRFDYGAVSFGRMTESATGSGAGWGAGAPYGAGATLGDSAAMQSYLSARGRVAVNPPALPALQLFVAGERDVHDAHRQMGALGANYALSTRTRAYGRYEVASTLGNADALALGQQRNLSVVGIDSTYMEGGRVYDEVRMEDGIDGRSLQSAMGVRNSVAIADGVRVTGGVEQVQSWDAGVSQTGASNRALTTALDWLGTGRLHNRVRASSSAEWRHSAFSQTTLFTLAWAHKLNSDWTLLARVSENRLDSHVGSAVRQQGRRQLGFAHRPVATDA